MCILFWALDGHPQYKFIFAANRDENLDRPSAAASWWHPNILSGLDLQHQDHGTWLGVNRQGRFAALTNFWGTSLTEPSNPILLPSRGRIIKEVLESTVSLGEFMVDFGDNAAQTYEGFNLIVSDLAAEQPEMIYCTNQPTARVETLESKRIYGLSNSDLNNPFPNVGVGVKEMERILKTENFTNEAELVEQLFELLSINVPFNHTPSMTIAEIYDDIHRSILISECNLTKPYGTRVSTITLVDRQNRVVFIEKPLFGEKGEKGGKKTEFFTFQI